MTIEQIQYGRTIVARFGLPGQPGVEVAGLRIKFKVAKDDTPDPNTATIEIWNLGPTAAALLQRPGCVVELFAGYADLTNLVFLGDVTRAVTTYEGADARTQITSGDGAAALATTNVAVGIKGKTTAGDAIKAVLKGIVDDPTTLVSALAPEDAARPLPNGYSASGPLKQVLRGLSRARLFDWTYIDGQLVIVPPDAATREPAVVVNARTGLVGSPTQKQSGAGDAASSRKAVVFKVFCNPTIRPRRLVRLDSREYKGWYLVRVVEHTGDTHANGEFFTTVEATEIKVS
jgi:hypothetical protein